MEYSLPGLWERLVLGEHALGYMSSYRQTRIWHREAGGQLFGRFEPGRIIVERATGPRRGDRRTRTTYVPDRQAEQGEIRAMHARSLHYLGDWHTHPERHPSPSASDRASMIEMYSNSLTEAEGFVLVVVGTAVPPCGLHVSWVTRAGMAQAQLLDGNPTSDPTSRDASRSHQQPLFG